MPRRPLRLRNDSNPAEGAGTLQLVTKAADVTMAQASSAQREPSMEEILASIRRIIEDSDTGRKPYEDAEPARYEFGAARQEPAAVEPARPELPARAANSVIDVDTFRAELRGGLPATEPGKPVTLAEVQAQIAAETPKKIEALTPALKVEPEPVAKVREAPQLVAASMRREVETPVASPAPAAERTPAPSTPSKAFDAEEKTSVDDDMLNAVLEDIAAEQASPPPVPESAPQPAEGSFTKPAIISEHAGRQVAAAFGELSEAFAAKSKKTFDDMAEEMMRPMLQDWLDNNLPTLVERLVREEIERVARGAH